MSRSPSRMRLSGLLALLRAEIAPLCRTKEGSSVLLARLTVDIPCHELISARLPWRHVESGLLRLGLPNLWTRLHYQTRIHLLRLDIRLENGEILSEAELLPPDA